MSNNLSFCTIINSTTNVQGNCLSVTTASDMVGVLKTAQVMVSTTNRV